MEVEDEVLMLEQFDRTAMQFGRDGMERLFASRVAVFGIGGVGGYCVEALARSGIGSIDLFDGDRVCLSNINRQIIAVHGTVGLFKVDVMRTRILEINPDAKVGAFRLFYLPDTADDVDFAAYDYIIDAVDTMAAKIELVCRADGLNIPIISSMGAANKLYPFLFEVADIYETTVCPMARIMRRELRRRNIQSLKVVYSREPPLKPQDHPDAGHPDGCRQPPSSNAFVPPVAGLIMAGEVIRHIAGFTTQ